MDDLRTVTFPPGEESVEIQAWLSHVAVDSAGQHVDNAVIRMRAGALLLRDSEDEASAGILSRTARLIDEKTSRFLYFGTGSGQWLVEVARDEAGGHLSRAAGQTDAPRVGALLRHLGEGSRPPPSSS